jgi:hypothetical protein
MTPVCFPIVNDDDEACITGANDNYKVMLNRPLVCPTEEDLGMLMSSVAVNARMCGWEGGKGKIGARQGD